LIVFLAVPALQRSSRNTQAKNEAANLVSAVNEYVSNHNGQLPSTAAEAATLVSESNAKNITTLVIEANSGSTVPTASQAVLKKSAKCVVATIDGYVQGNTVTTGGQTRQFALLYPMENKAGNATGCLDS
jgi:hypothetical protein